MNDRLLAFKVLNKIECDKAYSNLALDACLKEYKNEVSSASFVTALVYGVTERLITLDFVLSGYLRQPLKKLKPEVHTILRMGVYQLKFMEKVPASAAVNECVKLTKQNGCDFASGLVNSVLRKVSQGDIVYPETDNKAYDLSIRYSCPENLVRLYIENYGIDYSEGILACSLGAVSVKARVNTLKTDAKALIASLEADGITAHTVSGTDNHIEFDNTGSVESLRQFQDGLFHVQDTSSAICVKSLDLHENMTLVDVCSAPGGKAFTAAEIMNNKGKVLAFDLYEQRCKLISDGALRLGIDIIEAKQHDASVFDSSLSGVADRVLCDVPCSGLGIIGRKPEIKYKDLTFIDKLTQLQYNILVNASAYVKRNGLVVYSTCSLNKNENDNVCERFLASNNEFEKVNDYLTLMPHKNACDGFFIAVFRRK